MSFTITFYQNTSDSRQVSKTITQQFSLTGLLKDGTSIIDPTILFEGVVSNYALVNYMHIPIFQRYYYITDIRSIRDNLFEVDAHVDVLMSFWNYIKQNQAIIDKNSYSYNLFLDDGTMRVYQNSLEQTIQFPLGLTNDTFILLTAGGYN